MTVLLSGVSMTMSGIAPSPERASDLLVLLERVDPSSDICMVQVKSVLGAYAKGAAPGRDTLLEASNEWRENVPVLRDLRSAPNAPREVDGGDRPQA